MSSDPHDELARARARRARERGLLPSGPASNRGPGAPSYADDQAAAIERAREAWALRRAGRDAPDDEDDDAEDQE